ncbi:hypothetical protein BYT27DRAFT_7263322 [Phlegmacium glaucopus]|nr:hypothetical protein BYT27DRAFT_7263322 [Phlegmacium glaucopus]
MPPFRQPQFSARTDTATFSISQLAQLHGSNIPYHRFRPQPYPRWTPVPCTNIQRPNLMLPPDLMQKIHLTQGASTNKSTLSKDASRLQEFLGLCERLGIHRKAALPAREDLLVAWASSFAGHLAGRTVSAKLAAIKKEHDRLGLIWLGGGLLRRTLKGVEELRPPSSFYNKRAPVTIAMLNDLNVGLNRSSGLDNCIRAICFLSFFCQLRIGEILPPTQDLKKFNPHRHATFSHIAESTATNGACNLHLPWSKTQKAQGDDVWIPRQEAPLDPIHAMHKHFIKNKLSINHPLSAYRDIHNNLVTLTRLKFIHRINQILQATKKGYPRITGHCFRIGGTTFYLVSGVPPDMVKRFGRWRSHAFLEYWRCLDYLGKIHIDMLPLNLQPQLQRHAMRNIPKA